MSHPKKIPKRGNCTKPRDQLVHRTVRWEAGPCERLPKALKTNLGECQPSGSGSLRSDGSRDGQAGGMTTLVVAKDAGGESRKITLGSQGTLPKQA